MYRWFTSQITYYIINIADTQTFAYYSKEAQIDLVIDRGDKIVNLCEIKFYAGPYTLTKANVEKLRHQAEILRQALKRRKGIYIVLITSHGLKQNEYAINTVQRSLTLDDLMQ